MLNEGIAVSSASRILENLPFGILSIDADDRIEFANHAAENLLGRSASLLVDQPVHEVLANHKKLLEFVTQARQANGSLTIRDLLISLPVGGQYTVDGHAAQGEAQSLILSLTQQRGPDEADTLGESQTMAEVARILGHEVKNPLAGMVGAAQLLARKARDDQQSMLTLIGQEGARITRIIDRFSAFETFFHPRPVKMNPHEVLDQVVQLARASYASTITIREEYDPSLPLIEADPDHIHEACLNIIKNACEAISFHDVEDGEIKIATRYRAGFKFRGQNGSGAADRRGALEVSFTDNGPGIPEVEKKRIFSPFFTTKPSGAGIGLSVVAEIMSAHDGYIEVDSSQRGSSFRLVLPLKIGATEQ